MAEKKKMTIKEILIEMCCNDIRHRDEAQKILKCLSALSPIYPHQVRYDELTSFFHSSNDIRVEIAGILQQIDEYSYPLYESLLWITHADLIRIENFETDDDNTLALTVQQCINEAEWARQIEACVSQIPRVKVGDYKHYLAGMKKLTVSYQESSNFFRVVKLMNRINVLGGEDGEIIRDFMLNTCTFDVKVVDEHIRIINYLKSHAEQTTNLIEHHLDIMITLKLIGWYGIDYYYDILLEKAAIVNFTRTRYAGEEELFDNCCSEILSQPTLGPEERKTIVTNLKLFGEFILLKDYVILMRQFHDTDGHDQSSPLYTTFLETLNQHITLLRRHP